MSADGDEQPREPQGDWEMVAEVARRYEAEIMAGRLRASGIDARVIDKSFRQEPLPTVRSFAIVRVYVPADRADEAMRILDEPVPPPDGSGDETS
jgi:hypothetical protein